MREAGRAAMLGAISLVLIGASSCGGHPGPAETANEPAKAPHRVRVETQGTTADRERVLAFFATRPVYERALDAGIEPPTGVASLSAQTCATCHSAIAAEWAKSTHAYAWRDPQFQAEITKSDNRWLCLNCHTPLLVQRDQWPVGLVADDVETPQLVDNALFDAALRDEGVTCAGCHLRDGVIHGPGLPDSTAPHAVSPDAAFRGNDVCLQCHQAVAAYPGKTFVCTFETGEEWAASPYAAAGRGCVDCHMPAVERPAADGGPVRTVKAHHWRGAGIPKEAGVSPPVWATPPGLDLEAVWMTDLTVTFTNKSAGHQLPTGDPERWVQIDVRFADADGKPIGGVSTWKIGQTWVWWPTVEKTGDNRLAPGVSRTESVAIPAGAAKATVEASSHRMSDETAAYHHLDNYPRALITHRLEVSPAGTTGGVVVE